MSKKWLQENCDPDDPEEAALWAIIGFEWKGMRIPMGIPMAKALSAHLDECGFKHDPSQQKKKYRRPFRGQQNQYNGSATWVSMDTPDPDPVVVQDMSVSTREEIDAVKRQLEAMGEIPAPPPEPEVAEVIYG